MRIHKIGRASSACFLLMSSGILGSPALARSEKAVSPKTQSNVICRRASAAAAALGTAAASAGTLASSAGVAAVTHSSGATILTSVGVGGTGYLAGTLGGAGATALGFLSAPVVMAGAATVGVGGLGVYAYCWVKK